MQEYLSQSNLNANISNDICTMCNMRDYPFQIIKMMTDYCFVKNKCVKCCQIIHFMFMKNQMYNVR